SARLAERRCLQPERMRVVRGPAVATETRGSPAAAIPAGCRTTPFRASPLRRPHRATYEGAISGDLHPPPHRSHPPARYNPTVSTAVQRSGAAIAENTGPKGVPSAFATVEEAIEDIRAGRLVVVVD